MGNPCFPNLSHKSNTPAPVSNHVVEDRAEPIFSKPVEMSVEKPEKPAETKQTSFFKRNKKKIDKLTPSYQLSAKRSSD